MSTYSGLRVFVFLGVVFLFFCHTADVNAQVASLWVSTDIDGYVVDVGDEVTVSFFAEPAGEVPLYITAENIEVISIEGMSEHSDPILPSNYTTDGWGELIVRGVFTGPGDAIVRAHWDRPHPADDFMARADFEVKVPLPPATLEIVSGNNQHGESATALQPFVVMVTDRNGRSLPGVEVAFLHVTFLGGQVTSVNPRTDRLGRAATILTLGPEVGIYQVEASVVGYPSLTQTFTAAATTTAECEIPEPPKPTTLSIVSGYGQEGRPGSHLSHPFVVEVKDQYGEVFSGANVTFSVIQGSGRLSATTVRTNSLGLAQTTLTLGANAGLNMVRASISGISLPQIFTATAIAPVESPIPTTLEIVSGDNQIGEAGMPLAQLFIVGVKDQNNKALKGELITFDVTGGAGGFPVNTTQRIRTDDYGQASVTFTLGSDVGVNLIKATLQTHPSIEPVIFSAIGKSSALPEVYYIESGALYRFTGDEKERLMGREGNWTATSLTVDTRGNKIYWTEREKDKQMGRIRSSSLSGKNVKTLKILNSVPNGIVANPVTRRLYWTSSRGKIQSISVDGRGFEGNLIAGLGMPMHIALAADGSVPPSAIYWTAYDADNESWGIWSASLSGNITKKKFLDLGAVGELRGLAVAGDKLYWAETVGGPRQDPKCVSDWWRCQDAPRMSEGSIPSGIAVDAVGSRLYWTSANGPGSIGVFNV